MKIEILGTGCAKCAALATAVEQAVDELGIDAPIEKVTDIVEIADRGAIITPAVCVDGTIVVAGKVPALDELERLLRSSKREHETQAT